MHAVAMASLSLSSALARCMLSSPSSLASSSSPSLKKSSFLPTPPRPLTFTRSPPASHPISPISASYSGSTTAFFDEEEPETEEQIRAGYEARYGPAFGGARRRSTSGDFGDDGESGRGRRGRRSDDGDGFSRGGRDRGQRDAFEERVVQIRRVTKVVKGGKQLSFRAVVVVGDKRGKVGVGVGKAKEVISAVQKSAADARRHVVSVPLTKHRTFPHRAEGKYGAAKVMLRPAAIGTGVIAGGSVRVVLELAGVENALGKELGSENPLNNARAVVEAVSGMKQFRDVARDRGIPMEELWK